MKTLILLLAVLFAAQLQATSIDPHYADKLVRCIYQVEGGSRAKSPYGILSVKVKDKEARKVCLNTVRNNWRRWQKAGHPGEFVDALGDVYCPFAADPVGNVRWKKNMKALLRKK